MKELLFLLFLLGGSIALPIHVFAQTLEIENLWVDDSIQKQNNTIFMRSSQVLIVKLKEHQQADSFYFKLINLNDNSFTDTVLSSSVEIYHNLTPGDYEFHGAALIDSIKLMTPAIKIKVKSGLMGNWGFVILFLSCVALLFAASYASIFVNKLRGAQKLAELRADWTNMLHNDIGGDLSGTALRLGILKRKIAVLEPTIQEDVTKIYELLNKIQIKLRFVFDVVDPKKDSIPIMLEDVKSFGQEHAQLKGIAFEFRNEMNPAVNTKLDINRVNKLYLVMKEAIMNAVKYSQATKIVVSLKHIRQDLLVEICDDGVGFDPDNNIGKGNGLSNLIAYGKEGYMKVGIDSALGKGTCITIYIPQL